MERFIAFLLLILLVPVLIILVILLAFTLRESIVFSQIRLGKEKKEFVIYKFKTMKNGQITLVGKVLRKLGLDEIPQLVNIIKNEMSFVGPRPLTEADIIRLDWKLNKYKERWSVKPGITCLDQLSSICNAEHSMERDLFYVINKNLALDNDIISLSIWMRSRGFRNKCLVPAIFESIRKSLNF